MSQEIKYEGSFLEDTGLNKLWGNLWNADPAKLLPPNEAERQLMSAKYMSNAGQNEFINNSIQKLGGQKRTPTTMFTTPQQSGVGFGINPNQSTGTASTIGLVNSGTTPPQYMPQDAAWGALVDGTSQMPAIPANDPVRTYQSANGLVVDGKVGPNTYNSMLQNNPALAAQYKNSPYLSGSGSITAAVSPVQAMPVEAAPTQMFSSMYGGNPAEAYGTEALASQTAPIEGGSSMMDFFGLGDMTGKDWMGAGFGAAQLGLGAYGMFKGLDQMDTRLDQGQQALNLNREEYDENLRHRNAIVSQNKGA